MTDWDPPKVDRHHTVPPPPAPTEKQSPAYVPLAIVVALLLAIGVFGSWWAFLIVVALIVCVFLHELGHFLTARRAGMKVTEFFLGFGPRIWSFRRGEIEYGIKAIPAGAYVRILGMNNLEEVAPADEPRTYRQQGYWSRLSVAVAGSAMHFLIALVLLVAVIASVGLQRDTAWKVSEVSPNSPALAAGLQPGDRVVAIDDIPVSTFAALTTQIRARPNETVDLTVRRANGTHRAGHRHPGAAQPAERGRRLPRDRRGAATTCASPCPPPWWAPATSSAASRGSRWSGCRRCSAPKGCAATSTPSPTSRHRRAAPPPAAAAPARGWSRPSAWPSSTRTASADFFLLLAVINISLGLFNLFPLLPFDGGHVVIATYEAVRSRRGKRYYADVRKLFPVTYAVMVVFLFFVVGSLWLDVFRPGRELRCV